MAGDLEHEMLELREVFQLLDEALQDTGWAQIIMPTDGGLFTWNSGQFPNYIAIHQADGAVHVHHEGKYAQYTAEEWEAIKFKLTT